MAIIVDIDVMLARRKMPVGMLAERIGITPAKLAVLKNGRAMAVRFSTLAALCDVLDCQPGDLLRFEPDGAAASGEPDARIVGIPARRRPAAAAPAPPADRRPRAPADRAGTGQPSPEGYG